MSDNAEMDACLARTTTKIVNCDHKYCWDPEECTDYEIEEVSLCSKKWITIDAHTDKCVTCGLKYSY